MARATLLTQYVSTSCSDPTSTPPIYIHVYIYMPHATSLHTAGCDYIHIVCGNMNNYAYYSWVVT